MSTLSEREAVLRRALLAAAEQVEPAGDGLARIQARLRRPRPLPIAWAEAAWSELYRNAPGFIQTLGWQVSRGFRAVWDRFAPDTGQHSGPRAMGWLRPLAAMSVAVFVIAAGAYMAMSGTSGIFPASHSGQTGSHSGTGGGNTAPTGGSSVNGGASPENSPSPSSSSSGTQCKPSTPAFSPPPKSSPPTSSSPSVSPSTSPSVSPTPTPSDTTIPIGGSQGNPSPSTSTDASTNPVESSSNATVKAHASKSASAGSSTRPCPSDSPSTSGKHKTGSGSSASPDSAGSAPLTTVRVMADETAARSAAADSL